MNVDLDDFLSFYDSKSVDHLKELAARYKSHQELLDRIATVESQIEGGIGGYCEEAEIAEVLDDENVRPNLPALIKALDERVEKLSSDKKEKTLRIGRLTEQLANLAPKGRGRLPFRKRGDLSPDRRDLAHLAEPRGRLQDHGRYLKSLRKRTAARNAQRGVASPETADRRALRENLDPPRGRYALRRYQRRSDTRYRFALAWDARTAFYRDSPGPGGLVRKTWCQPAADPRRRAGQFRQPSGRRRGRRVKRVRRSGTADIHLYLPPLPQNVPGTRATGLCPSDKAMKVKIPCDPSPSMRQMRRAGRSSSETDSDHQQFDTFG